jgi:isopentenyl phosphate kinase
MTNIVIIKLGGSSITHKDKDFTTNPEVIRSCINQIVQSKCFPIIVHGGGSFGHPVAKRFNVKTGSKELDIETRRKSVSLTRYYMNRLHSDILQICKEEGLSVISIPATGIIFHLSNTNYEFYEHSLLKSLEMGLIPIFFGDLVYSEEFDYTILSGDTIIRLLIEKLKNSKFKPSTIIFGSDVDGVFSADPKIDQEAKLFDNVPFHELNSLIELSTNSLHDDVTGGMKGKLIEIQNMVKLGVNVKVINILKEDRLYQAITNEQFSGSYFTAPDVKV